MAKHACSQFSGAHPRATLSTLFISGLRLVFVGAVLGLDSFPCAGCLRPAGRHPAGKVLVRRLVSFPCAGCLRPAGRHPAGKNLVLPGLSRNPELIPTSSHKRHTQPTVTSHSISSLACSVPHFRLRDLLRKIPGTFHTACRRRSPCVALIFRSLAFRTLWITRVVYLHLDIAWPRLSGFVRFGGYLRELTMLSSCPHIIKLRRA